MSLEQKIAFLRNSMNKQLNQVAFISEGNVGIPTKFLLNNTKSNASNEVSVDSLEQAEEIRSRIGGSLIDSTKNYDSPLYLSVEVSLPR